MSEQPHDLHIFMAQITDEMGSEYKRIYSRAAEDPGTAGDEGEENWAALLRDWLPPPYHVATKGRLIGTNGALSPQIDVLVLKPTYPKKLLEKKVWLASGVAAAFECKTTMRAEHIAASAERCKLFKGLYPARMGSPRRELKSPLFYGLLAHSHCWKSPGSKPIENVNQAIEAAMTKAAKPSEHMDLICVADLGTWSSLDIAKYEAAWALQAEETLTEQFGGPWGVQTAMICSAANHDGQKEEFRPIGALVSHLTQALAWEDTSARDLADYYRLVNLWGNGKGMPQLWPSSVYSEEVRSKIMQGGLKNGGAWDEWNIALS